MKPKVYIIILNWNKWKDTIECLKSVFELDYKNYSVLVIDNASDDDSVIRLKEAFPCLRLIQNFKNTGYTGGNNQGIKIALSEGAEYVWLLNNDTIVETDSLSKMVTTAEEIPLAGIVSPAIHFYDDPAKPEFLGRKVDLNNLVVEELYKKTFEEIEEVNEGLVMCVCGTAMLVKANIFEQIGFLKEDYFAYFEDTEFSIRAIVFGIKNKLALNTKVLHRSPLPNQVSRPGYYYYYMIRNGFFMWVDLGLVINKYKYIISFIVNSIDLSAKLNNKGLIEQSHSALDGMLDAICGVRGSRPNKFNRFRNFYKYILLYPYFLINVLKFDFTAVKSQVQAKFRCRQ